MAREFRIEDLKNRWFIAVFVFPMLCLMGMAGFNEYYFKTSQTLVLPVEGYDPRDLFSGYSLMYRVKYGLDCPDLKRTKKTSTKAYICFQPEKKITLSPPSKNCSLFIKGKCYKSGEFRADVDRYYIPENEAKQLEQLFVKASEKQVILSVTKKGRAFTKDVLIDGQSISSLTHRLEK